MDFRQLEVFVATVKQESFSGAASVLCISQPTVTAHIHALEKELHTQLIHRTTKSFEVTPEGQRLYDYAVSMLHLHKTAVNELDCSQKKELHIGSSSVPGQCLLPKLLAEFHQSSPDTHIYTTLGGSMDIIRKVEKGHYDVGFVGTITDAECTFIPLVTDELVLVAPNTPRYKAMQESQTSLAALLNEPFILRSDDSGTKLETEFFLQRLGLSFEELHVIAYVNDAEMLCRCVQQGLGISMMSRRVAEAQTQQGDLIIFPLDEPKLLRKLFMIHRKKDYLPKTAENFIEFVKTQVQEASS